MIFELAVIAGIVCGAGGLFKISAMQEREFNDSFKPSTSPRSLPPKPVEQPSPTGELLIELLNEDDGWTASERSKPEKNAGFYRYEHTTGVRYIHKYNGMVNNVSIQNGAGVYELVDLTEVDRSKISEAFKAHQTRARDRRQGELRKALAERIISGASVRPVLGNDGVLPDARSERERSKEVFDREVRLDSAGLLTYDSASQQIVTIGGRDKLQLSDALRERYDIRHKLTRAETLHYFNLLEDYNDYDD